MNLMNNIPTPEKEGVDKYCVRLYDVYDGHWIDVLKNVSYEIALECWYEKTRGGKKYTRYADGAYYDIFPNDTRMIFDERRCFQKRRFGSDKSRTRLS